MAYIIADKRERNGAIDYLDICVENNNNKCNKMPNTTGGGDITFKIEHCTIGDYIISIPSKHTHNHYITAAVIERKTWEDLASSLNDGRMDAQHDAMKLFQRDTGADVYYIIEGNAFPSDTAHCGKTPYLNLRAKIRHNMIRGVPFIQTKNGHNTALTLAHLARDYMQLYAKGEIEFPCQEPRIAMSPDDIPKMQELSALLSKYMPQNIIQAIDKLFEPDNFVARPILHEELTAVRQVSHKEVMLSMWAAIPSIGGKTAMVLYNAIDIKELFTMTKLTLQCLTYSSGNSLSTTKINNIMRATTDPAIHAKMLACIKGVTLPIATSILKEISLENIINGQFNLQELLQMKIKGKRCASKLKKIISILCPEYVPPLAHIPEDSLTYKFLVQYGDPDVLYASMNNLEISTSTASFTIDEVLDIHPNHFIIGKNNCEW